MKEALPIGRPASVDALVRKLSDIDLPHPILVDAVRQAIASGEPDKARRYAEGAARALLRPVINATGVLLHTNLGRAPLEVQYSARPRNLEMNLETGRRGSRSSHVSSLLARATGAEAALIVNNGAAAILLVLAAMGARRPIIVSRGELVEIGGAFRIPEIIETSGALLIEVGATNRTRLDDYREALRREPNALILKVHQSNYRMIGFTEQCDIGTLSKLNTSVIADIGSGLLDSATPWLADGPPSWLANEPAARQALGDGATVITFSGDKLLGGPQAGIIAGQRSAIESCASHPLYRAFRPGGLVLATLQETLLAYLRRDISAIPFWHMATLPLEEVRKRSIAIASPNNLSVVECTSVIGGGSLPGVEIPSFGIELVGDQTAVLRSCNPPVIARVADGHTICDVRTVDGADDKLLGVVLDKVTRS